MKAPLNEHLFGVVATGLLLAWLCSFGSLHVGEEVSILQYSPAGYNEQKTLPDATKLQLMATGHLTPISEIFIAHDMQHHGLRLLHKHYNVSTEGAGEMVVSESPRESDNANVVGRAGPQVASDRFVPNVFSISKHGSLRPLEYTQEQEQHTIGPAISQAFLVELGEYLNSHGLEDLWGIETDSGLYPSNETFVEYTMDEARENILVVDRGDIPGEDYVPTLWEFEKSQGPPIIKVRCVCYPQGTHPHYEPSFSPSLPPDPRSPISAPTPRPSKRVEALDEANARVISM
jgi:hypothetical protein